MADQVRAELSDALRAYQTGRRKEIYEALHPETKQGASGGTNAGKARNQVAKLATSVERFTASTSKATGRSERTVQREAERGEKLGLVLNRIAGTSLDKGGVEIGTGSLPPFSVHATFECMGWSAAIPPVRILTIAVFVAVRGGWKTVVGPQLGSRRFASRLRSPSIVTQDDLLHFAAE